MQAPSDAQLLRDYAERGHEAAFREIVTRHTDLVYSAALRQMESADLAADIAQGVFVDLARKAKPVGDRLSAGASLVGWLYRSTRFAALTHLRNDRRRATHERLAMEQLLTNSDSTPAWEHVRPLLDEALDGLDDTDREALLLRYFKNNDLRSVGAALGVSDDAAQKRVSRAVERLREFFGKRGVTVGAGGLTVIISANAVQAAPVGLVATISTAAALAGSALAATTTATVTKAIAMTTLQKTLITATFAVLAGAGIYEARQAARLSDQVQTLKEQQAPLVEQIAQLTADNERISNRLAQANPTIPFNSDRLRELLRLRGEVGALRRQQRELEHKLAVAKPQPAQPAGQPASQADSQRGAAAPFQLQLVLDEPGEDSELMTNHAGIVPQTFRVQKTPLMNHTAIRSATVATNPYDGMPQIEVEFSDVGKDLFAAITRENLNKRLAIVLGGQMYSAPVIRSEIPSGKAQITGNFTEEEAKALAAKINEAINTQ